MLISKHKPKIGNKKWSMVFPNIDRMCSCIRCLCNNNPTFTSHCKISLHNREFSTNEKATYLFMINNTNFFMNHTCVMSLVLFAYFVPKKFTMHENNFALLWFWPTKFSFIVLQVLFHHGLFQACNMLVL
jgi:hypothetical protein